MKQVNNLRIKFSKTYQKYQVIAPSGVNLEEFGNFEDAYNWAKQNKDFVMRKGFNEDKKLKEVKEEIAKSFAGSLYSYVESKIKSHELSLEIQNIDDPDYADWYGVLFFGDGNNIVSVWLTFSKDDQEILLELENERTLNSGKGNLSEKINFDQYLILVKDEIVPVTQERF